jgi:hypothetical protein
LFWTIDLKTGDRIRFLSRLEAKKELKISEATFHKYLTILISCWADKFRYIPRQTHWSEYQIHCLYFVKQKFGQGLNRAEVIELIGKYQIPDPANSN